MHRVPGVTQEEMDDIEDNQWRRKSYALAQHDALPVPMPLPVYPPPKPCPPPVNPVVIRPHPRPRPPPPGYGYRPSFGFRPSRMSRPRPPVVADRLPTLAEGGSTCPTPEPMHRVRAPFDVTPPIPPLPSVYRPPVLTTFQALPSVQPPPICSPSPSPSSSSSSSSPLPPPMPPHSSPQRVETYPPSLPQTPNQYSPPHEEPGVQQPITHVAPSSPAPSDVQTQQIQTPPTRPKPALPSQPPPTHRRSKRGPKSQPQQKTVRDKQASPVPRPRVPPPDVPTKSPASPRTQPPPDADVSPSSEPRPKSSSERSDIMVSSPSPPPPSEGTVNLEQRGDHLVGTNSEGPNVAPISTDHNTSVPQQNRDSSLPQGCHVRDEPEPASQPNELMVNQVPAEVRDGALSRDPGPPTELCESEGETQPNPGLTEDMSNILPPSPLSQEFPSPPTHPDNLPPTPPSLSRSPSPVSLESHRLPTSIKPAPSWQPSFPMTPLTRTPRMTPTLESTTPKYSNSETATPNSLTPVSTPRPPPRLTPGGSGPVVYPPTPPSSVSHAGPESVTPASSYSSLSHGPGKTSMGEDEVRLEPYGGRGGGGRGGGGGEDNPRVGYPSVLSPSALTTTTSMDKIPPPDSPSPTPTTATTITTTAGEEQPNGINDKTSQQQHQQQDAQVYQAYKSRFWILGIFSLIAFMQTIVWGAFGPITESALAAFPNWTAGTIAAFPTWAPIIVIVFTIPMMWLTQRLGLRLGVLSCALFITLGTMMRCFTSQQKPFTIVCHVSSILFSFSAGLVLSLPAMIAAVWFPPSERITATAVGALMCQLGSAGMYLSPLLVRAPSENPTDQEREDIRGDIMVLMYIHFGVSAALLIAVAVYFPARPPTPPSASSAEEKTSYFSGVKAIVKNPQLLMVLSVYALSFGVPVVWIGVLNLSLIEIDIHQDQAMGVAVTAVVASCAASFLTARVADKMYGHLRVTVIGMLGLSSVFFFWFLLLSTRVITPSLAQAYVTVSGGLCFEYATVPLLVELAVELGYPIPESVTGASLTFLFNIASLIFLGFFQLPDVSHLWVSYVLLLCVSLTIIPMIFVKETHKRSDTDRKCLQTDHHQET